MKHKHLHFPHYQVDPPVSTERPSPAEELSQRGIVRAPRADEVATRAYYSYLSQGSRPGHDIDDWMAAEAQLSVEKNIMRVAGGGFPNRT